MQDRCSTCAVTSNVAETQRQLTHRLHASRSGDDQLAGLQSRIPQLLALA